MSEVKTRTNQPVSGVEEVVDDIVKTKYLNEIRLKAFNFDSENSALAIEIKFTNSINRILKYCAVALSIKDSVGEPIYDGRVNIYQASNQNPFDLGTYYTSDDVIDEIVIDGYGFMSSNYDNVEDGYVLLAIQFTDLSSFDLSDGVSVTISDLEQTIMDYLTGKAEM